MLFQICSSSNTQPKNNIKQMTFSDKYGKLTKLKTIVTDEVKLKLSASPKNMCIPYL